MTIFGAYDREQLAAQGLLSAERLRGCGACNIVADSDQRTRETGKALAAGFVSGLRASGERTSGGHAGCALPSA